MSENYKDRHLNLFNFFNNNEAQFYENNLTRALAICLDNDEIFLHQFLNKVDSNWEDYLVKTGENKTILIDIQKQVNEIETANKVIGVALTAEELPKRESLRSQGSENSITDLVIQVNDLFIVIEVKRTKEDCRNQLKKQLDLITHSSAISPEYVSIKEFTWKQIGALLTKSNLLHNASGSKNIFTSDLLELLEVNQPNWVEVKNLAEIPFPDSDSGSHPQINQINRRLKTLKSVLTDAELQFNRATIPVDHYDWVNELNVMPILKNDKPYIFVGAWPGDTKNQGIFIYKDDKPFKWKNEVAGYELIVEPYLKFAHFNAGVCWVFMKDSKNSKTHTKTFFEKYIGKWAKTGDTGNWKKSGASWNDFYNIIESLCPNWVSKSDFDKQFQLSGRNYFYVSAGFAIKVLIPYNKAQKLDRKSSLDKYPLAEELDLVGKKLLNELASLFTQK